MRIERDLRLPRAFKAWTDFKTDHLQQIGRIGTLPLVEVVSLADTLSISTHIDKEKVAQLKEFISGDGNRIVFMRHGEHGSPEWISSIPDPALRKIRMMQNPLNREDSLTNKGLVDVFGTAFILLYIQEVIGKKVSVLSSENRRAKEAAEIIATVIPNTTFSTQEGLNCIIYRDENDNPPVTLEQLLEDLPSGTMPWNFELVDKWCRATRSGVKQSEAIVKTVEDLVKRGTLQEGNDLFVVLTHTQQLAEVLREVDKLQNPDIRFPELTMIAVRNASDLIIFPRGVLSKEWSF